MKLLKKVFLGLILLFVLAQFFRPEKNEGSIDTIAYFESETNPPDHIKGILKQSCYDCHSDVTVYPWYNNITPVNYWMADHIKHGKKHFNVSKWEGNAIKRKDHKFEELIEMVEDKSMPLKSYTWTHKDANLSEEDIKALVDWAKQVRFKYSLLPEPQ